MEETGASAVSLRDLARRAGVSHTAPAHRGGRRRVGFVTEIQQRLLVSGENGLTPRETMLQSFGSTSALAYGHLARCGTGFRSSRSLWFRGRFPCPSSGRQERRPGVRAGQRLEVPCPDFGGERNDHYRTSSELGSSWSAAHGGRWMRTGLDEDDRGRAGRAEDHGS
ncbi:hypothetical protein ACFWAR_25430 [Streptomyces sp. NPDC059917]|uniref:hypothetical protein n=1 Tax=Streptomyces sp. NPDC059917 TaxID=3347002 RepID=UPI0036572128